MKNKVAVIILAAGKGERMKSDRPKVLHPVCGRPMLGYVLDLIKDLKIKNSIVVLGYKYKEVKRHIGDGIKIAIQKKISGTADAVKTALPLLKNFKGAVLVLYGDNPLLKKESISKLLKYHIENGLDVTLLTAQLDKPTGYGRVLRDKYSSICRVVEEHDANDYQKDIKEVNTGIMCFNKQSLEQALRFVLPDNRKKEYYLTDVIGILYKKDRLIDGVRVSDINEALGINSREGLAFANKIMQERINSEFMQQGITIVDPQTTFINFGAKIGKDTKIYPFTVIESNVTIGKNCLIGPFAHLRDGTRLKDNVVAGNFLEIVRSSIGNKTLLKHFGYIGDSLIGKKVNIGAGTVTANFDGKEKNTTIIKDEASIGSDTVLVAPVRIGKLAVTGAGSVVTKNKNVPDKGVVVGVPAKPLKKR